MGGKISNKTHPKTRAADQRGGRQIIPINFIIIMKKWMDFDEISVKHRLKHAYTELQGCFTKK